MSEDRFYEELPLSKLGWARLQKNQISQKADKPCFTTSVPNLKPKPIQGKK